MKFPNLRIFISPNISKFIEKRKKLVLIGPAHLGAPSRVDARSYAASAD
jgi:hypothetical protein